MANIDTTKIKDEPDKAVEGQDRFATAVNGKNQGVIIGVKGEGGKYTKWLVEGDPYNNEYTSSDDAVVAAAKQNTGRVVKLKDKSKNKRQAKKEKYGKA